MSQTSGSEYQKLVMISKELQNEYAEDYTMWKGSPFEWIKSRPSRQIGAIGEKIVEKLLTQHGFRVQRSPDSEANRIVENSRVEIKFSTLWDSGLYKFQQLRNQNYDFIIMIGVSPQTAHCWVVPKKEIMRLWHEEHVIRGQHTGADGHDTAWISLSPENINPYFQPYGNDLKKALMLIALYTGKKIADADQKA